MSRNLARISAFLGTLAVSGSTLAGEQYLDQTGFAASGYDVVAYFELPQAPIGEPQPLPVAGSAAFTAEWNGAMWAFVSAENRDRFLADPGRYAPAYDGHCAYGVASGYKVPANPALWRIVDGRLYLNITEDVVRSWNRDIPGYIAQSEAYWSEIEIEPAADDPVPDFDPSAAPSS